MGSMAQAKYQDVIQLVHRRRAEALTDGSQWGYRDTQDVLDGLSEVDRLAFDSHGKAEVVDVVLKDGETIENVVEEVERLSSADNTFGAAVVGDASNGHPQLMVYAPDMQPFWTWWNADAAQELSAEGLWQVILKAAPTEQIYGSLQEPSRNGWLYTLVNELKTEQGDFLWHKLCDELDRREKQA